MDKNKIIFLDMDGVVNSDDLINKWIKDKFDELQKDGFFTGDELRLSVRESFSREFCNSTELIFPELAEKIKKICDETDCCIVWSSTWRKLDKYKEIEKAKEMFSRRGIPGERLIGYTEQIGLSFRGSCRGTEISRWIEGQENKEKLKCAVIDDRYDACFNLPKNAYFFQVSQTIGITDEIVDKIIKYLNSDSTPY